MPRFKYFWDSAVFMRRFGRFLGQCGFKFLTRRFRIFLGQCGGGGGHLNDVFSDTNDDPAAAQPHPMREYLNF